MCNEEQLARWAREGMSRRQFGALGAKAALGAAAGAAAAACVPVGAEESDAAGSVPAMSEREVAFATADGTMDAWLAAPAGRSPAVILWPDIAGLRETKQDIARRLAGRGYAALVLNQYYRDTPAPIWRDFAAFAGSGGWGRARAMRGKLSAEAVMADARAAIAWLDAQDEIDPARGIGTQGYCMGGPFALWTAAAVPARVRAAASFHGGGLYRPDSATSPHALLDRMDARLLIAIARDDHAEAPQEQEQLRAAAQAAGRPATVEVYDGDHGWTVPDSPAYAPAAEARAWNDLMALYETAL